MTTTGLLGIQPEQVESGPAEVGPVRNRCRGIWVNWLKPFIKWETPPKMLATQRDFMAAVDESPIFHIDQSQVDCGRQAREQEKTIRRLRRMG